MTITKAVGKSGSFGVDCHYDIWHIQVKGRPIFMPLGIYYDSLVVFSAVRFPADNSCIGPAIPASLAEWPPVVYFLGPSEWGKASGLPSPVDTGSGAVTRGAVLDLLRLAVVLFVLSLVVPLAGLRVFIWHMAYLLYVT